MMTLKLQRVGTGIGVVLPEDVLAQLGLREGDELLVRRTREGLLLSPLEAEVAEEVRLGRGFMEKYRKAFEGLAK